MANTPMPSQSDLIADAQSYLVQAHEARERYVHRHESGRPGAAELNLALATLNTQMAQVFATLACAVGPDKNDALARAIASAQDVGQRVLATQVPYPFRTLANGDPIPTHDEPTNGPTDDD